VACLALRPRYEPVVSRFAGETEAEDRSSALRSLEDAPSKSAIKPVMWRPRSSQASDNAACKSVVVLPDVDHPSVNQLLAQNANALVLSEYHLR
jgi:hypothetical protein